MKKEILKIKERMLLVYPLIIFSFCLLVIGIGMNNFVMEVNNNHMPVKSDFNFIDSNNIHQEFSNYSDMKYPMFSDRFTIGEMIFSLGDFIIIISLISLFIFSIYNLILECKLIRNIIKSNSKKYGK